MRYLGKASVSSFLTVCLKIAWYFLIVAMPLLLLISLGVGLIPAHYFADSSSFEITGYFLSFDLPSSAVTNPRIFILSMLIIAFFMMGFALAVVHQLRKIFANLRAGKPFAAENAKRTRAIGFIIVAGSITYSILKTALGLVMLNSINISGIHARLNLDLDICGIFIGLIFLVLSEVFRVGAKMQEEQDLTV